MLSTTAEAPQERPRKRARAAVCDPETDAVVSRIATGLAEGRRFVLTGTAGTGKSFVTRLVVEELLRKFGRSKVAVVAPTGIAAVQVGGTTLHAYFGSMFTAQLPRQPAKQGREKVAAVHPIAFAGSADLWRLGSVRVVVLDEFSMVGRHVFEAVDWAMRAAQSHRPGLPFGGCGVLLVGDPLQLPPVQAEPSYASPAWCGFEVVVLRTDRRTAEPALIELQRFTREPHLAEEEAALAGVRQTVQTSLSRAIRLLADAERSDQPASFMRLFCSNADTDGWNAAQVAKLRARPDCERLEVSVKLEFEAFGGVESLKEEEALKKEAKESIALIVAKSRAVDVVGSTLCGNFAIDQEFVVGARMMVRKNHNATVVRCDKSGYWRQDEDGAHDLPYERQPVGQCPFKSSMRVVNGDIATVSGFLCDSDGSRPVFELESPGVQGVCFAGERSCVARYTFTSLSAPRKRRGAQQPPRASAKVCVMAVPVGLAYAVTFYKAQGLTISALPVVVQSREAFATATLYIGLTRPVSAEQVAIVTDARACGRAAVDRVLRAARHQAADPAMVPGRLMWRAMAERGDCAELVRRQESPVYARMAHGACVVAARMIRLPALEAEQGDGQRPTYRELLLQVAHEVVNCVPDCAHVFGEDEGRRQGPPVVLLLGDDLLSRILLVLGALEAAPFVEALGPSRARGPIDRAVATLFGPDVVGGPWFGRAAATLRLAAADPTILRFVRSNRKLEVEAAQAWPLAEADHPHRPVAVSVRVEARADAGQLRTCLQWQRENQEEKPDTGEAVFRAWTGPPPLLVRHKHGHGAVVAAGLVPCEIKGDDRRAKFRWPGSGIARDADEGPLAASGWAVLRVETNRALLVHTASHRPP